MAGDLTSAFDFANPNAAPLPVLPAFDRIDADALRAQQEQLPQVPLPVEDAQVPPEQAPGVRRSRALPYALDVDGRADPAGDAFTIEFANAGTAGAVLHVYDRLHLDRIPRRYTVEAGTRLADTWDTGADAGLYDFWLLGPNGFHRHFSGSARTAPGADQTPPQVRVRRDPAALALIFSLANGGNRACTFVVGHLAYQRHAPQSIAVAGGQSVEWQARLPKEHGWYDIRITVEGAAGCAWRYAGRLESGRDGISDPALGPATGR